MFDIVPRRDESRELILTSEIPLPVSATYDMCIPGAAVVVLDARKRLTRPKLEAIRVTGYPKNRQEP